jgi:putative endonuclease
MYSKQYYVYITACASKRLYVGVTNNLQRRILEHRGEGVDSFAKKYAITKLVYFEHTHEIMSAIKREKQIKGWIRAKKIALIESLNPTWRDLYSELFGEETLCDSSGRRGTEDRQPSE